MVCMLFKNYRPVCIPETLAMRQFHFLFPDLLRLQNSFEAAVNLLDEPDHPLYAIPSGERCRRPLNL
jgi:hypothetical protein